VFSAQPGAPGFLIVSQSRIIVNTEPAPFYPHEAGADPEGIAGRGAGLKAGAGSFYENFLFFVMNVTIFKNVTTFSAGNDSGDALFSENAV
jgi:hypothetical protein